MTQLLFDFCYAVFLQQALHIKWRQDFLTTSKLKFLSRDLLRCHFATVDWQSDANGHNG